MQNGIRKLIHSTVSISVDILRVSLHVRLNKHQLLIADIYHHQKKIVAEYITLHRFWTVIPIVIIRTNSVQYCLENYDT